MDCCFLNLAKNVGKYIENMLYSYIKKHNNNIKKHNNNIKIIFYVFSIPVTDKRKLTTANFIYFCHFFLHVL